MMGQGYQQFNPPRTFGGIQGAMSDQDPMYMFSPPEITDNN